MCTQCCPMRGALQDCSEQHLVLRALCTRSCAACHFSGVEVDLFKTGQLETKSTKLGVLENRTPQQTDYVEMYLCFLKYLRK